MAPTRNPRVDYLRIYPGLNDFSDALEAIPQTLVRHLTHLKEVDAKYPAKTSELTDDIKSYFQERSPDKLREISKSLDLTLPVIGQKMHIASLAAEQVSHQLNRLNTDYRMICDHEIPLTVQVDEHDPAFIEVVPQEKPASAGAQARREAREAREARRATQQQESRSSTPNTSVEPQIHYGSRRRGRTTTPQTLPAYVVNDGAAATGGSENPGNGNGNNSVNTNNGANTYSMESAPAPKPTAKNTVQDTKKEPASDIVNPAAKNPNTIPPVVMPIEGSSATPTPGDSKSGPNSYEDGPVEVIIGLKRKRDSAPKSTEPVYCYCQRGSFGEMVGCDGSHCEREWFHLECIGLSSLPRGQWFCEECRAKLRRR